MKGDLPRTQRELLDKLQAGWSVCRGPKRVTSARGGGFSLTWGEFLVGPQGQRAQVDKRALSALVRKRVLTLCKFSPPSVVTLLDAAPYAVLTPEYQVVNRAEVEHEHVS